MQDDIRTSLLRSKTSHTQDTDRSSKIPKNSAGEVKEEDNSDFEFKDEMSQLKLPVRPAGENPGPRGSARKRPLAWMPSYQTWPGIGNWT
ncbi:hypothetical protein LSTR_LSTR000565 [Laodelphax striatellus]|uniref:Uncharacterized protein n=1 Tax=Laodelphax striatellus TaxID=195883 RepID=A0A482WP34_LAOST|nr:hypothetical protein LSTR_LSTR000565 [Laodelphax striatellus]